MYFRRLSTNVNKLFNDCDSHKMSSALLRQALEFVDPEVETGRKKRNKRKAQSYNSFGGQDIKSAKNKKSKYPVNESKTKEQITEENIKKLLALSKPTTDKEIADKIVKRAIQGKPLLEKPVAEKEHVESIFFANETDDFETEANETDDFETEYFCS